MDWRVRLREVDRRAARPADTSRPHPRDERRQLSPQTEQAATAADVNPHRSAAKNNPSNRFRKLSSSCWPVVMHFYSGPPMHLRSGVDKDQYLNWDISYNLRMNYRLDWLIATIA